MNASAIKNLHVPRRIFENSLKIARALRLVQFERIFKYHEYCKFLISRSFVRLLICHMTEKNCELARVNLCNECSTRIFL